MGAGKEGLLWELCGAIAKRINAGNIKQAYDTQKPSPRPVSQGQLSSIIKSTSYWHAAMKWWRGGRRTVRDSSTTNSTQDPPYCKTPRSSQRARTVSRYWRSCRSSNGEPESRKITRSGKVAFDLPRSDDEGTDSSLLDNLETEVMWRKSITKMGNFRHWQN